MSDRYSRLADILLELEKELRQLQLWEITAPSSQALQSPQPFCFDTLRFTQWLQFVFIERVKGMIELQAPLPENSGIVAIAEESFKGVNYDASTIIRCLADFDTLIAGQKSYK